VVLGVAHHPLDVILWQRRAAGDGHRLLLAGAQVLRVDVHDAVGVDVEGDLICGTPRARRQAGQLERAQLLVVRRDVALALEHLDEHGRLVVVGGREDLGPLGRDGGMRSISLVKMPPLVSMPSDSGVTSSSRTP